MRAAGLLLAAGLLAGCGSSLPARFVGTGLPADAVAERVRAEQAAVRTVYAPTARVRSESPDGRGGSYDAEVAIERPQRFRMIAYAFGGMLYDLLLDGKTLAVYAPRDNVVIRHTMGQIKGTGELTGVEKLFARTPLARLLLGPDRFAPQEDWRLLHRDEQTLVYGVFVGPRQRAEIEVQEGSLLPRVHRVLPDEPGGPDLAVRYREWAAVSTKAGEVWWPFGIEVESRAERFYMDFRFADVHLNDDLPPETFQQEIPADAKEQGEGKK